MVAGVVALWGGAARLMNIAFALSQRSVRSYRRGELVGPNLMELGRAVENVIVAHTRVCVAGDHELISAAGRVLELAQGFEGVLGGAPWWRPRLGRKRQAALEKTVDDLSEALRDLRELTGTRLGPALPELTASS